MLELVSLEAGSAVSGRVNLMFLWLEWAFCIPLYFGPPGRQASCVSGYCGSLGRQTGCVLGCCGPPGEGWGWGVDKGVMVWSLLASDISRVRRQT